MGMVSCTCHPNYAGSVNRRTAVQAGLGKTRPHSKITKAKRVGGIAQVVEHLPLEAQGRVQPPVQPKKKKKKVGVGVSECMVQLVAVQCPIQEKKKKTMQH
jgi:hypothetical protein